MKEHLPEEEYSVTETARALVAWGALQAVTAGWKEKEWMKHLREIGVSESAPPDDKRTRKESRIRVNSNIVYPGTQGQVITADIDDLSPPQPSTSLRPPPSYTVGPGTSKHKAAKRERTRQRPLSQMSDAEIKATLRRLSKLVLAGYGGASLLFFGVSPVPKKADEQANLASAIDASEAEAAATSTAPAKEEAKSYSWWDVLLGKHDSDIFHSYANHDTEQRREEARQRASSAVIGDHSLMPRFWVLSDHGRKEVVLVIRGELFCPSSVRAKNDPTCRNDVSQRTGGGSDVHTRGVRTGTDANNYGAGNIWNAWLRPFSYRV
jgi:sn1-specific diacylglycerol lipase